MARRPSKPPEDDDPDVTADERPPGKRAPRGGGGHNLLKDDRMRRKLESAPVAAGLGGGTVKLPEVAAPSLEGISVLVPAAPLPTAAEVLERFAELRREHARKRDRKNGEKVAEGDDVLLDVIGYAHGRLIPFSIRENAWMAVEPMAMLPGFHDGLIDLEVGLTGKVDLVLPATYPVEALRGARASFLVDVNAAREVTLPADNDPAFLKATGMGTHLDEVMATLAAGIRAENEQAQLVEAADLVLDELAVRIGAVVPASLVDEEIRRRWAASEGKACARKNFSPEEQQDALDGWLTDVNTRVDAERRLRISLALAAIAKRDGITVTRDNLGDVLDPVAERMGMTVSAIKAALKNDPAAATHVYNEALHLLTVKHVVSKATIRFADDP